jgi:hypothetical protein
MRLSLDHLAFPMGLLAFCAACTVDAVERKHEEPDGGRRIAHANALAAALSLDMT